MLNDIIYWCLWTAIFAYWFGRVHGRDELKKAIDEAERALKSKLEIK